MSKPMFPQSEFKDNVEKESMSNTTLSPWAKAFSRLISRWGGLNVSTVLYVIVILFSVVVSVVYHFIMSGEISFHDTIGTAIFATIVSPFFIYGSISLVVHLERTVRRFERIHRPGNFAQRELQREHSPPQL